MKKFILSVTIFAISSYIPVYGAGIPVGLAPNGTKDVTLTRNSSTVNMTNDAAWSVFSNGTACRYRTMPTSVKSGKRNSIPVNTFVQRYVNKLTPYLNFSGCSNGELQRQ